MGICDSKSNIEKSYKNENYKKELISPIKIKRVIEQMNKSICKIITEKSKGTGFLFLILYPNIINPLKVLITCNHIFNDLKIGNKIKLIFENKEKIIIIDEFRRAYTNKEHNITIIQLKENEFEDKDYLQMDDYLMYKESELKNIYKNKMIYILHYPSGEGLTYSVDRITNIENNLIEHICKTDYGSSGAPILNLENNKVIGIHIGNYKSKNCYFGEFIKLAIDDFIRKYKPIKTNENIINNELINKEENFHNYK